MEFTENLIVQSPVRDTLRILIRTTFEEQIQVFADSRIYESMIWTRNRPNNLTDYGDKFLCSHVKPLSVKIYMYISNIETKSSFVKFENLKGNCSV